MSDEASQQSLYDRFKAIRSNWVPIMCVCTVIVNHMTSEIRGELKLEKGLEPLREDIISLKASVSQIKEDYIRAQDALGNRVDLLEENVERNYQKKKHHETD